MDRDGPGATLQARRRPASREFSVGTLHQLSRKDRQSLRHLDPREVGADATREQSNHRMNLTALRAARYPGRSASISSEWKGGTPATVIIGKIAFEFPIHRATYTRRT